MTNRTAHALELESMALRAGTEEAIRRAAHDVAVVLTEAILGSDTRPDGCPESVRPLAEIVARLNMAAASLAEGERGGERCVRCNAHLPPCDPGESGSWTCLECSEVGQ